MSDSRALQLNLLESLVHSNNDDDEFQSVSSSIGEDKDTYRVLDEALIGSSYLYETETINKNSQERGLVEFPEHSQEKQNWPLIDNRETSKLVNSFLPERITESVDTKMIEAMEVLPVREIEELRKERNYQLEMKKRINDDLRRDDNYSLPRLFNNDDDNNNTTTDSEDDQVGHQGSDIDFNRRNPTVHDEYELENLYDSLEAEHPNRTQEFRTFPSNSHPMQPVFNENNDNLGQFYPKSPQKELKSTGPVKGDHMIFSQMWSDEQVYHEIEKMANDYNKNQSLYMADFVNQGNENYMPPPVSDFQGYTLSDYEQSPREKFWNNLSNKQQIPKQSPISIDFIRKPKTIPKASTNYVEYNKINYGKVNQNKSYMARHNFRKDISDGFSRIPPERKVYSGRSEPILGTEQSPMSFMQKPSSAEEIWKKRSANLIYQMEKKLPLPPGKLQKYNSDSRVNYRNTRPHYLQPLKSDMQPSGVLVPVEQLGMSSPSVIDLKPISKDFVMEDGQRISVDISLKLMSPPLSSRMSKDETNGETFQPLLPFYVNEQAHQATNLKNPRATNLKEQQDSFSLQTLADSPHQKPPASEYQGPHNTDTALNNKVGYVARYQRQRDPQQHYKVYSVDDYRKMQKEVKLGKLGPDLDSETLREKVEKRQKQFDYAKKVYEANKESLKSQKPAAPPKPQRFITEEQQNRRKLAIEYAKSVPKPLVKPTIQAGSSMQEISPSSQNQLPAIIPGKSQVTKPTNQLLNCEELEKLCLRHEQDKRNAANIRKKITPS